MTRSVRFASVTARSARETHAVVCASSAATIASTPVTLPPSNVTFTIIASGRFQQASSAVPRPVCKVSFSVATVSSCSGCSTRTSSVTRRRAGAAAAITGSSSRPSVRVRTGGAYSVPPADRQVSYGW